MRFAGGRAWRQPRERRLAHARPQLPATRTPPQAIEEKLAEVGWAASQPWMEAHCVSVADNTADVKARDVHFLAAHHS